MSEQLPPLPKNSEPVITVPDKDRLTVVETVYHQSSQGFPTVALGDTTRFSRELASDEQPYERHKVAGEKWQPLDCGWIDSAGMLVIRNDEGHFAVNPTPEQKAEMFNKRIVELSFDGEHPVIQVPPTETCRFYPSNNIDQIKIRCKEGKTRYSIYLMPE
jgi:hypothetical protein